METELNKHGSISPRGESLEWEEVLAYAKLHYLVRDRDLPSSGGNGKYWLYDCTRYTQEEVRLDMETLPVSSPWKWARGQSPCSERNNGNGILMSSSL